MPRILRTPLAEDDLLSIWDYIAEDSLDAADRVVREISEKFEALASSPRSGTPREELAPSLRSDPVGNYIVFYLPLKDGIEVIRVLHGAMDIRAQF